MNHKPSTSTNSGKPQLGSARERIEQANAAFSSACAKRDAAAVSAMYTEEAEVLPPNAPIVKGRKSIEQFWRAVMESGIAAVELKTSEVEDLGDTAIEIGSATIFGSSHQVLDRGKYVVVWKHVAGQWKLHRDCWNSNEEILKP